MSKSDFVTKKRFVISKSMLGKGMKVKATFKDGKVIKYDVDKVFESAGEHLKSLNCWDKYGNYTKTSGLPSWAKDGVIK